MIGSVLSGKYRVVRELGRGAMGVVYQAEHLLLKTQVAVKMLAPEFMGNHELRDRFFREARTQSTLRHPSVNRVMDYFEQDQHLYLVLEFVEGVSLATLIDAGKMSSSMALPLMTCVLEGLDYVHRQGVIHRDVKPSNILVDGTGRAVLIDFGIAVRTGGTRLTRAGGRVGSVHYMSPEQIQRPQSLDHRTDIYSSGVVLYELLTGTVPFDGGSDYDVEQKHITENAPDPRKLEPSVSPTVSKAVLRAIEKDPAHRFQTCAEFLAALSGKDALPDSESSRKRQLGLIASGVIAALCVAYFAQNSRRGEPSAMPGANRVDQAPAKAVETPASPPSAALNPPMTPAIPPDQILMIERWSLSALEQVSQFCQRTAERRRLEKEREAAGETDTYGAHQYAVQISQLDRQLAQSKKQFSGSIDELRRYSKDAVAQLLSERRQASGPDEARYVSAIERYTGSEVAHPPTLKEADCPGYPRQSR